MTDTSTNPANPKKKKRSLFADDDFFVRKPKARPAPKPSDPASDKASGENGAKPEPVSTPTTPHTSNISGNRPETIVKKQDLDVVAPADSGENAAFHSANQSFDAAESTMEASHIAASVVQNNSTIHDINTSFGDVPASTLSLLDHDILSGLTPMAPSDTSVIAGAEHNISYTQNSASGKTAETVEEDDFLDSDLKEFFSGIAKKSSSVAENSEHERLYQVKVTSRSGFPCEYTKEITGETTFADLLEQLSRDTLRDSGDPNYWKWGALVWIEGRSELKPFFKPSTLRIPQPAYETTKINCLYIPKQHLANFELLYSEFEQKAEPEEDEFFGVGEKEPITLPDDDGTAEKHSVPENGTSGEKQDQEQDKGEYFVIGLKGKDNKRIEAEVGPDTKIRSILEYFMQVKKIELGPGQKGKIMFEDEELDLDAEVKDTELEEDFEVQVFIR